MLNFKNLNSAKEKTKDRDEKNNENYSLAYSEALNYLEKFKHSPDFDKNRFLVGQLREMIFLSTEDRIKELFGRLVFAPYHMLTLRPHCEVYQFTVKFLEKEYEVESLPVYFAHNNLEEAFGLLCSLYYSLL